MFYTFLVKTVKSGHGLLIILREDMNSDHSAKNVLIEDGCCDVSLHRSRRCEYLSTPVFNKYKTHFNRNDRLIALLGHVEYKVFTFNPHEPNLCSSN